LGDESSTSASGSEGESTSPVPTELPLPYLYTAREITPAIARRAAALGQSRCMRCRKWLPTIEFRTNECRKCDGYKLARARQNALRRWEEEGEEKEDEEDEDAEEDEDVKEDHLGEVHEDDGEESEEVDSDEDWE
jgi:hypothetical protein